MGLATEELLAELIDDAKLAAAYAQRAGLLKDGGLINALSEVEALDRKTWSCPQVANLQIKLNEVSQAIPSSALVQLKSGWLPFQDDRRSRLKKMGFVAFSFMILILCALATFSYNNGSVILAQLEEIERQRPAEKIGQIARQLIASNKALSNADRTENDNLGKEAYFRLLDEWNLLDYKLSTYIGLSSDFVNRHDYGTRLNNSFSRIAQMFTSPGEEVGLVLQAMATTGEPVETALPVENPGDAPVSNRSLVQYFCSPDAQPFAGEADSQERSALHSMIERTKQDSLAIACTQNVNFYPGFVPHVEVNILKIRHVLNIYGLWLLPALYGAFGATLYHLRAILNPILPDPSLARITLRIALGAFAGVILAWFWIPSAELEKNLGHAGLSLFGAAFLVGFSIDVFFAFLDRFVTVAVDAIGRIGTSSASSESGA